MKFSKERLLIGGLVLFALVLRWPLLNGSLWLDEAAQVLESARPFTQQLQIVDDFQPPLLHFWIHFLMIFSRQEWWLRLGAAVIPSLVVIVGTYLIGKKLFSPMVGVLAALLLATSSFAIFFAQELRPYALPAMWATLSWWVIVNWLQKDRIKFDRLSIAFMLISIAGWYSSYLYPFLFVSQVVFLWFILPKWRQHIFRLTLAVGLAFLPWLPMFFAQLQAGQHLRTDLPGWEKVVSFDQFKSLALVGGKFTFGVADLELSRLFIIIAILGIAIFLPLIWSLGSLLRSKSTNQPELIKKVLLISCWLVLPILLAWLVSFAVPVLQPKRVLFSLPAFYSFLAFVILQPFQNRQLLTVQQKIRPLQIQVFTASFLAILFFLTINLGMTMQYYTQPKYQREDWRSMHELILARYPSSSVVVFAFPTAFAPWRWYDDGSYPVVSTEMLTTDPVSTIESLKKVTEYPTVLVFDYLRDLTDPHRKIEQQLRSYGYVEVDQLTPATPLGIVHVFQKKTTLMGMK